jgi:hypothetical protein
MFDDIDKILLAIIIIDCILVPLGIWKLIELIIWVIRHVFK